MKVTILTLLVCLSMALASLVYSPNPINWTTPKFDKPEPINWSMENPEPINWS